VLTLAEQPNALLVPSQAVQTGQGGQFVFVVKSDQTVESRPVVVSRILEGNAIVDRGVSLGEVVVTDGQLGLVPGARVQIKTGSQGG
jgi:multidrug efflux system membrane fusion protein